MVNKDNNRSEKSKSTQKPPLHCIQAHLDSSYWEVLVLETEDRIIMLLQPKNGGYPIPPPGFVVLCNTGPYFLPLYSKIKAR